MSHPRGMQLVKPHYTEAQRQRALHEYDKLIKQKLPIREIAQRVGVWSPSTLLTWVKRRQQPTNQDETRGRPGLLKSDHRDLLAGACYWIRQCGLPLHYHTIHNLCMDMFGIDVEHTWIYHFCQEFRLTRQRVRSRTPTSFGEGFVKTCLSFIQELRDLELAPSHVFALDEKGVWDNAHPDYTLGLRGR